MPGKKVEKKERAWELSQIFENHHAALLRNINVGRARRYLFNTFQYRSLFGAHLLRSLFFFSSIYLADEIDNTTTTRDETRQIL